MHLPINIQTLLHSNVVESDRIEYKSGWNPEPILKSICAFANDFQNFGGGYIIIGVEEKDGRPVLPPKGINDLNIDKMQKDLTNLCYHIKPDYTPITSFEVVDGKTICVIWVPGGQTRPYSAPRSLSKKNDYQYFIRKGSSTALAKNDELKELLSLTSTVPFDDRINHQASLEDIKLPLIQSFLKEVKSDLLEESRNMDFADLCRQMAIVEGGNDYLKPRNVGLLFFNDQPHKFFPYIQIDVVYFPDGEGGDQIEEEIFKGPIDQQIRDALRYIRNNFITERVLKIPNKARAKRFFNYPYTAIEEALVNAVYHRSFEIREPIEVRINRDNIRIVSHPGADPSILLSDVQRGKMITRRYRNRRIGDLFKELDFTEGRGTGVPKMRRALKANGSPEPIFSTNEARVYFATEIRIHPEFLEDITDDRDHDGTMMGPRWDHDGTMIDLDKDMLKMLEICQEPQHIQVLMDAFNWSHRTKFRNKFISPLLDNGLLEMTLPDKPKSKLQKYKTTNLGTEILSEHKK